MLTNLIVDIDAVAVLKKARDNSWTNNISMTDIPVLVVVLHLVRTTFLGASRTDRCHKAQHLLGVVLVANGYKFNSGSTTLPSHSNPCSTWIIFHGIIHELLWKPRVCRLDGEDTVVSVLCYFHCGLNAPKPRVTNKKSLLHLCLLSWFLACCLA